MQSTRADFKELCKVIEGRWIGEVVWVADWPGFGKKGDKFTDCSDFRISHGDTRLQAMIAFWNGDKNAVVRMIASLLR
jgi:hypothetical protein